MASKAVRDAQLWSPVLRWENRSSGEILIWREDPLGPYPDKINERLVHWAGAAPGRVWMADREGAGEWQTVTYGEALECVRSIGQFLLDLDLSVDRPLLILSENSIAHALMALGAQHVGVPSAAIAPAYASSATGLGKLEDIARQVTPGLVFAENANAFRDAVDAVFGREFPLAGVGALPPGRPNTYSFEEILRTRPTPDVDRAYNAVGPDTVAKFLFTSGTTGSPKAVIQTQRMLCSNQEMVADCYQYFRGSRRSWWTGRRGTTRPPATSASISRSTTAEPITSIGASPLPR